MGRRTGGASVGPRGHSLDGDELDLSDRFCADVVSAVSEIFNNVALHSYAERAGEVSFELDIAGDHLTISMTDTGSAFDPADIPAPELEALPEGGMGIHIARACMVELDYTPGPPNTWRMTKYASRGGRSRRLSSQI